MWKIPRSGLGRLSSSFLGVLSSRVSAKASFIRGGWTHSPGHVLAVHNHLLVPVGADRDWLGPAPALPNLDVLRWRKSALSKVDHVARDSLVDSILDGPKRRIDASAARA